ncbi:MAG: pyridoxamine 5'-phosphate oxidase family protein [Nitrospirales bacterium]|nr:pyridoxamine 5'-phosphate oxidase family protein [Nitrospirales bacterium]
MKPTKTFPPSPGSFPAEVEAQERFGSKARALQFYENQVVTALNSRMQEFIARQEMCWIATADQHGQCDSSFRAGPHGFVSVLDARRLIFPEYRGNGVMASIGNILANPRIGLLFLDLYQSTIGLHVNGRARVLGNQEVAEMPDVVPEVLEASQVKGGRHPECWVLVDIDEAYIHCSKHVPQVKKVEKQFHWGTDDEQKKGGDFFRLQSL